MKTSPEVPKVEMEHSMYKIYQSFFSFYDSIGAALFSLKSKDTKARNGPVQFFAGYLFFHFLFTCARFLLYLMNQDRICVKTFGNLTWLLYGCFGILAYCTAAFQTNKVNEFLASWRQVEEEILEGHQPSCKVRLLQDQILKKETKVFRLLGIAEALTFIINVTLILFNITGVPDVPVYPYSLLVRTLKIDGLWYPAVFLQLLYAVIVTQFKSQIEFLSIGFASSIQTCLKILTEQCDHKHVEENRNHCKESCSEGCKLGSVEKRVEQFLELEELVKKFNGFFRWPFIIYKGIAVIVSTLMVFVSLRKRPSTPYTAMLVFYATIVVLSARLSVVGFCMGKVYTSSKNFLTASVERLCEEPIFDTRTWHKISALKAFGFRCGNFYVMKPNTILTYFSVIVSYLVVTLQFKESSEHTNFLNESFHSNESSR